MEKFSEARHIKIDIQKIATYINKITLQQFTSQLFLNFEVRGRSDLRVLNKNPIYTIRLANANGRVFDGDSGAAHVSKMILRSSHRLFFLSLTANETFFKIRDLLFHCGPSPMRVENLGVFKSTGAPKW